MKTPYKDFRRLIFPILLGLVLSVKATPCLAQPFEEGMGPERDNPGKPHFEEGKGPQIGHPSKERIMEELGLNPEQKEKLAGFRKQDRQERKTLMESLKKAKKDLREELDKPVSNPKELERRANEIKKLQNQTTDLHIKSILQMKSVLTPEQFEKLKEKAKKRHQERKQKPWSFFERFQRKEN